MKVHKFITLATITEPNLPLTARLTPYGWGLYLGEELISPNLKDYVGLLPIAKVFIDENKATDLHEDLSHVGRVVEYLTNKGYHTLWIYLDEDNPQLGRVFRGIKPVTTHSISLPECNAVIEDYISRTNWNIRRDK